MAEEAVCRHWHPGDCEGTSACPPRCPRYVAADGAAYTVQPRAWGERHLVAFDTDGAVRGEAYEPADGIEAYVELDVGVPTDVGTELARQLVARAYARGADRLRIRGPTKALADLGAELGDAARTTGDRLDVALRPAAVEPLLLAPARFAAVGEPDDLDALVEPASVAVVGATDRPGSIGRVLLENLLEGFDGEVVPVTPTRETVFGLPAVGTLEEFEAAAPELTVVAVPATAVYDAVADAVDAGTRAIAILSAGFGESDVVGARRERSLRDLVGDAPVVVVGPNALGVASTRNGLNASFAPTVPSPGSVAVASHSGAMVTAILDRLDAAGIGVRDVVSLGNAVDLGLADLLRYWGRDPGTEVVIAYVEDLPEGRRFVEVARSVTPTTPVVVLKGGETTAGARAAASHTGAIVEADAGYEAAFDAAGVIRVRTQQALFDVVQLLDRQPLPFGDRVAIVTNAGGPGVVATDAVGRHDVSLASLTDETVNRLEALLPGAATPGNPVDVLGDADVDRFVDALEVILADPGVDVALVTTTPHPLVDPTEFLAAASSVGERYGKPVVACLGGRDGVADGDVDVPVYPDANRAVRAIEAVTTYTRRRRRPRTTPEPIEYDSARVEAIRAEAGDDPTRLGVASIDLLEAFGVSTPRWYLVRDRAELEAGIADLGDPLVLKVTGPAIGHKTDVGGVRTGIGSTDAGSAYDELVSSVHQRLPATAIEGIVVQEAVEGGVELLVGVTRHERFGPILTLGLGGEHVEQLGTVVHALAPVTAQEASELLENFEPVRRGPRGGDPPDVEAAAEAIARLSHIPVELGDIPEFEVNPLIATPTGAYAVDLLVEFESGR